MDSETTDPAPNALLIGAPRSASTSLAIAMAQHPDVFVCSPKEPHFLAMHGYAPEITGIGCDAFVRRNRLSPERWRALFQGRPQRCRVDASVSTLSYPETAIENIRRFCPPDVKLVAILRNPVARAFSSYDYCRTRGWTAESFEEGLEREGARIAADWQHLWFLAHLSRYERRLRPFLDAFGPERLHVVITEEFAADPGRVMDGLFAFLDLDPRPVDSEIRHNASGVPTSRLTRGISAYMRERPALRGIVTACTTPALRERLKGRRVSAPPIRPSTRATLSRNFAETTQWVEDLLDRPLPMWRHC